MLFNVLRKMDALDQDASVEQVGEVLDGKRVTPRDFTTVLTQLKQRRAWRLTLRVGEWLHLHGSSSLPNRAHYQVMLSACAASGAANEAQQLADTMNARGIPTDPTILSTLVLANERARQPARALALLDELEALMPTAAADERAAPAEAEAAVAKAVAATEPSAREAAVATAVDVFLANMDAKKQTKPAAAPPADADGAADASAADASAADATAPSTAQAATSSQPTRAPAVSPLAFAYASAIRAHDLSGDWKGALGLYERMRTQGVPADAHCFSAALGACRRGGQGERARSVLAAAHADGKVAPNGVMYTLAMAACNAAGEWEESLALLDERRGTAGLGVDAYAYSVAMAACAQGRQASRALALLDEMESAEGEGARECRGNGFAWNNAMVTCNKAEEFAQALALYDRMRNGACAINEHSVAAAIVACRGSGAGWQRAQEIFDGSREVTRSSSMCYAALMDALSDGEQWALVLRYYDERTAAGLAPTAHTYERAIEACDRVDADRAMVLFEEMKEKGL